MLSVTLLYWSMVWEVMMSASMNLDVLMTLRDSFNRGKNLRNIITLMWFVIISFGIVFFSIPLQWYFVL